MRDTPTLPAVLVQLRRLASAHGKPYGLAVDKQGDEYLAAFLRCGLPMQAIERAVDEAIDLGTKFPRVAELIARARDHRPKTDGERQGDPDTCPHCGVEYFYAGYQFANLRIATAVVVLPKVRCACPLPDEGWYTPAAMAWTETDPKIIGMRKPKDYGSDRYRVRRSTTTSAHSGFSRAHTPGDTP